MSPPAFARLMGIILCLGALSWAFPVPSTAQTEIQAMEPLFHASQQDRVG